MNNIEKLINKYQGKCFVNEYKGQYTRIIKIMEINNVNNLYIKMLVDMVCDDEISKNTYIFVIPEWFNPLREIAECEFLKQMDNG